MEIAHELNQLDFGGVEKVIRNIIKYDSKNKHKVLASKDGAFRKKLEEVGAEIIIEPDGEDVDVTADVIHVHSGGDVSTLAFVVGEEFPVIETIHSPVRSPNPRKIIKQRVGVCNAVSGRNADCMTILNGIDFSEMEPTRDPAEIRKELGIPDGKKIIGRLGRIGRDKNLEEWLLVCHYLQKQGCDFVPLIVGDEARDCKGYRGRLKLMAASLPVKNIVWAGFREDVSNYLQIMDVFLYPSATEGFGLVFAEAMFNNAVVVTWATDVTRELFGGYALLACPEKGIGGLVHATDKALNDQNIRDEFMGLSKNFVISEYEAQRMSLQYQEVYERCYIDFNRKDEPKAQDVVPA
ncbi:MAG: WbnK-like protein [Siphoviridae sp. ctCJE6]|nr:MAG: WbnK-like protein [Siphoviridae sp. ctCJE6]